MIIKDALKQTIALVKNGISADLLFHDSDLKENLVNLEKIWAFTNLHNLIEKTHLKPATRENLAPFFDLLASRWQTIRGLYQYSYNYLSETPLTKIFFSLATELSRNNFSDKHRFEILMPTLKTYNANLMLHLAELDEGANAAEVDRIQLNHFILDRWDRIINILECLDFAKEDAVLKHTSAQIDVADYSQVAAGVTITENLQAIILDSEEAARVIYHSQESCELHRVILELYRENGKANALEALENLRKYLDMGGMSGGFDGSEAVAGGNTYVGIRRFYDFTKSISLRDYEVLLNSGWVEERDSYHFKKYWAELLQAAMWLPECLFTDAEIEDIQNFVNPYFEEENNNNAKALDPMAKKVELLRAGIKQLNNEKTQNALEIQQVINQKKQEIALARQAHKKNANTSDQVSEKIKLLQIEMNNLNRENSRNVLDTNDKIKKIEEEINLIHQDMSRLRSREILCAEQFSIRIKVVLRRNAGLKDIKPMVVVNAKEAFLCLSEYLSRDIATSPAKKIGIHTYLGIKMFYNFLQKISVDNLPALLNAAWIENGYAHTFSKYWAKLLALAVPRSECEFSDDDKMNILFFMESCPHDNEVLCIEQLVVRINHLLSQNEGLVNIKPVLTESRIDDKNRRITLHANYAYARSTFEEALRGNHFKPVAKISDDISEKLTDKFTLGDYLKRLIQSHHVLTALFLDQHIRSNEHLELVNAIDVDVLHKVLATPEMLLSLLHHTHVGHMVNVQKALLEKIGRPFLANLFPIINKVNIALLKTVLPEVLVNEFFPQPVSSTKIISLALIRAQRTNKRNQQDAELVERAENSEELAEAEQAVTPKKRRLAFEHIQVGDKTGIVRSDTPSLNRPSR